MMTTDIFVTFDSRVSKKNPVVGTRAIPKKKNCSYRARATTLVGPIPAPDKLEPIKGLIHYIIALSS
jgi:hypothetical protein